MAQFFSSSTQLFVVPLGDDTGVVGAVVLVVYIKVVAGVVGAVVLIVYIKVVPSGWPFDDTELSIVGIVVYGVVFCTFVVVVIAAVEVVDSSVVRSVVLDAMLGLVVD